MKIHWTTINQVIEEAPNTWTYMLDCPEGLTWDEGAHIHLALQGFNSGEKPDKSLVRHMSIATLPDETSIGITTRIKEDCSVFKSRLKELPVGGSVAVFKTHSNIPLKRENKPIYLLSCGVGIATFRPLVKKYVQDPTEIEKIHSLSIDSSANYLFADLFKTKPDDRLSSQYVDDRQSYYHEVEKLTQDKHALFYIVGSEGFLRENIAFLRRNGIQDPQITLDKHESRVGAFFS